jgi:eukaryotic-like serine/threonine-protein kinase
VLPGARLGTYEIIGPLGAGGMGEVYRARDLRLGREIALKVLPEGMSHDPEHLARFEREARIVAGLNHPNIVTLHSVDDDGDIRFLTMELVDGQSLSDLVTPGGLPIKRALDMAVAIADALAAAHERGVLHRDLKPANVMVTREGHIKVLDFGLARAMPDASRGASAASTLSGLIVGTPQYLSPEMIRGEALDARADLFGFGVMLYELLAGRRPFAGANDLVVTAAILNATPEPISQTRKGVPPELERLVNRCLAKQPGDRPGSAREVGETLRQLRRGLERAETQVLASERMASIAVLPFVNRSRDEADEYFADGITEDVIAQLCKVRTLKVISRASVMIFKARQESLQDIAAKLQVGHLIEGSVRRVGDRVRIVAQLVDPESGRSLWTETYDRQLTDIFEIQTDVALHIADALRAELTMGERERLRREPTSDMQAYELYLRGRQHLVRFTVEDLRQGIEFFQRAIDRDPGLAPAHVGLALAHTELADQAVMRRDEAGTRARAAAQRAVELDPELGDAHCAVAYARLMFDLDWAGAEAGFKRALELSPGNAFACDLYGRMCAGLERFDEAIALQERANELDPLTQRIDLATSLIRAGRNADAARVASRASQLEPHDARIRATLGWALIRQGQVDPGIAEMELASALMPGEDIWLAQLGEAYGLTGRTQKARDVLRRLEDPSRPEPASPYHLAYVHTGLGDAERAMDCLERSYEDGTGPVYGIKGSFLLAPLRGHPRFAALLKRMGLG